VAVNGKEKFYKSLPETPGVYLMKGARGRILYIGKAANLKRRVSSYFLRPHNSRIEKMVSEVKTVGYKKTDTALEALILESELIKKHGPPYNVKEKDDKSFLYVEITKEKFPRVLLVRGHAYRQAGKTKAAGERWGPFTSASSIREALRIVRKIFPFSIHPSQKTGKFKRVCFDYEIGLCPGTCVNEADRSDYLKNIRNIKLVFRGKKKKVLENLEKEMHSASRRTDFEKAAKLRRQIFALRHIQDVALISDDLQPKTYNFQPRLRIEGYDVSNISGTSAVGAMIVFLGGRPDKKEYRLFKIRTIKKSDDVGMLKEVFRRRLAHAEWPLPDAVLVDGGRGQVNAAERVIDEFGLSLPVVGIAKGAKRKKNEFIGSIPYNLSPITLVKVRNESHRFARNYHKRLRNQTFMGSK
jgi:excinuclease ABC subunit C